jgi:hypothetical protein
VESVTQRSIEIVIGRLTTDEDFRREFLQNPERLLSALLERGADLTHVEMAALVATDSTLWDSVADRIDPRLQKVSLKNE